MKEKFQLMQNLNSAKRVALLFVLLTVISFSNKSYVLAQANNFFGTSPGSPSSAGGNSDAVDDSNPNAVLPGLNSTNPNTNPPTGTDFSGDEKRMQRKYKDNLNSAKKLIDKGTQMMKSAGKDVNDPDYKKGKILKETGEKWMIQLKANSPFAPAGQKSK